MHWAVEGVRKCYSSLLSTLSSIAVEGNDPVAKGLYNVICNYKFVVFNHFLCDILGDLTYLANFSSRITFIFLKFKALKLLLLH